MNEQLVYMADLEEFVEVLARASGTGVQDQATKVTHAMGDEVARLAVLYAPVNTGELASSISAIHSPGESRVVAGAPYAAYVEFGTWSHNVLNPRSGTYEIRPRTAKALRFQGANGPVFAQVVNHPGVKPQPFLGPAHDEVVETFTAGIANVGTMLVVG